MQLQGRPNSATSLWRVRVQVHDTTTDEEVEVRSGDLAAAIRDALERAEAGTLEPLPARASPFRRYSSREIARSHYVSRAEAIVDDDSFARTRSAAFASRIVDAGSASVYATRIHTKSKSLPNRLREAA